MREITTTRWELKRPISKFRVKMILKRCSNFITHKPLSTSEGKLFHKTFNNIKLIALADTLCCGCRTPNDPSCINQTRNGTLSPFWEWTLQATYEGTKVIRSREYDSWSYVVSCTGHEKARYFPAPVHIHLAHMIYHLLIVLIY